MSAFTKAATVFGDGDSGAHVSRDVSKAWVPVDVGYSSSMVVETGPIAKQERELLAQIIADPKDTPSRLVYADWLAGRGSLHGELISLQFAIDRMLPDYLLDEPDLTRRRTMEAREAAILAELALGEWLTTPAPDEFQRPSR